jgi:hypothetical protein
MRMSRFYSGIWGFNRKDVVNPFLRQDVVLFVGQGTIGQSPFLLLNFNPYQIAISGATVGGIQYSAPQLRTEIYNRLAVGITANVGPQQLDIQSGEFGYSGTLILDFEEFRPSAVTERRLGKIEGHDTLTYDSGQGGHYTFTDQEYNAAMETFWTGALARYHLDFPKARFAFYQAPMNFTWFGAKGWFSNQCQTPGCTDPGKGAQVNDLWGSDAELDWLYRKLDCIAAHSYMIRVVGDNPGNFESPPDQVRGYHRDLAIRAIRLARRYTKPCLVYNERFQEGLPQGWPDRELNLDDYSAWFDGYLDALELTEGGSPMMGAAFWRAASDPIVAEELNTFLREVFAPPAVERFALGSKAGILRGAQ